MGEITSHRKLSEYKPSPFVDVAREAGAPEVSKSIFTEIRELFRWKRRRDKRNSAA